jgi:hypothetical protein
LIRIGFITSLFFFFSPAIYYYFLIVAGIHFICTRTRFLLNGFDGIRGAMGPGTVELDRRAVQPN